MGSGKSSYSQKKWIRTSWFADARPVNKDWKREDERGSKKAPNVISVIRQPWDWMDCPRQLFQRQNPTRFQTPIHLFLRTKKRWAVERWECLIADWRDREAISNSKRVALNPNELEETGWQESSVILFKNFLPLGQISGAHALKLKQSKVSKL